MIVFRYYKDREANKNEEGVIFYVKDTVLEVNLGVNLIKNYDSEADSDFIDTSFKSAVKSIQNNEYHLLDTGHFNWTIE